MIETIHLLEKVIEEVPQKLLQFSDIEFQVPLADGKWSRKQLLGHLIDSAANNHQRFVRIQTEKNPFIRYDQNAWNNAGNYQSLDYLAIIGLWENYDKLLLHIIKNISTERIVRLGCSDNTSSQTLSWYIEEYVKHMMHHLNQIFNEE